MESAQHPVDAQLLRSAFGSGISERFANALALSRDRARQAEPTQKSPAAGRWLALSLALVRSRVSGLSGRTRALEIIGEARRFGPQTLLAPSAIQPPHTVRDVWGLC